MTNVQIILLACILAAINAVTIVVLVPAETRPALRSGPSDETLAELDGTLRELAAKLGQRSQAALRREQAPPPAVDEATPSSGEGLGSAIEELRELIRQLAPTAGRITTIPAMASEESARESIVATAAAMEIEEETIQRRHRFWSLERVLATYGQPEEIIALNKGVMLLGYKEGDRDLQFHLFNGFVINLYH